MRSKSKACRTMLSLLTVLLAVYAPSVMAQSAGTGALTGTVTDPSAAVIRNATVTLTNSETNQTRTVTTGADGTYRFSLLPPGSYKFEFSAAGFKTAEVGPVTINVTETPVLDRAMEVGQQAEQVLVQANAASCKQPNRLWAGSWMAPPLATNRWPPGTIRRLWVWKPGLREE